LLPGHVLKLKTQVSSAPGIAKPMLAAGRIFRLNLFNEREV